MKVIFLDVDGVLNCYGTRERICGLVGIEDRLVKRHGREPSADYRLKTEYVFTAWNGRSVVKKGTAKELGDYFGMFASAVHEYARRGIRRRKDGVFFEREKIEGR